jgi:Ni/Fe-hydrogenase subunit HybB-like protein
MNTSTPTETEPLVPPGMTDDSISERISGIVVKRKMGRGWIGGFAIAFSLLMMFNYAIAVLFTYGVGIWGIQIPVAWGFAIVNFVWWVGIGHAGTFISAVLYLCHQEWRTSINRFTESMTLFAVACAGIFPILHLGRPWLFYYLFPYPNTMDLWPQFRSPLIWDMFAVTTYAIVSVVFYFVGLMPDLATLRDRSPHRWQRIIYGLLALGWRGSGRQWSRYKMAYLIMAGLATPLVVSVHSIVSLDFAGGIVPGWHTTIMPFYFVAAALQSGFAMGLILIIPVRHFYHLKDIITGRHLANMAKLLLATSLVVGHGYFTDTFMSWYSADPYEKFIVADKFTGAYAIGGSPVPRGALLHSHPGQRRSVARSLHSRGAKSACRLSAVGMADVLRDEMGLDDPLRQLRSLPDPVLCLHSRFPHGCHERDARTGP